MYDILQRVCTSLSGLSTLFWPWNNGYNPAKRIRNQVVDITEDEEDDIIVNNTKKLKLHNSYSLEGDGIKKCAKTQTDGMARKRSLKANPWNYQSSTKENWQVPLEVVDLVEDTPNKLKNAYRPPQHVRSPHRNRRKSFGFKQKSEVPGNNIASSTINKVLSEKPVNNKQSFFVGKSSPFSTMASGRSSNQEVTFVSLQRSNSKQEFDHDIYSKMLNSFIGKETQQVQQAAINTGITVDLTAEDDLISTSTNTDKSNCICLDDDSPSLNRSRPIIKKVKPVPASIEVYKNSPRTISLDDDDDDDDVQIIKTPPVAKVNSLQEKIKAQSLVADIEWTEKLFRQYEEKKSEMEKMTKMLSAELKIVAGRNERNFNNKTLKLLSSHLEITEAYEEETEPSLPELTSEMLDVISKASKKQPPNEILISKYSYNIKRIDINSLTGLNWLNDEIINFYTTLIVERSKENSQLPQTYSFSTFFYLRLLNSGYTGVKRWTRKVDIFAHDLIIIPVHLKMHWCLAAIDFVNRTINYYDSMGTTNDQCLNKLEQYIIEEYRDKKGEVFNMDGWSKNNLKEIPRQMNGSDCGVFCCTFAEFLSRRAKFTFEQNDMPYLRQKMIYEIVTGKLLV